MANANDDDLERRCKSYLSAGPPASMTGYVPGSLVEVVIAHGAKGCELDPELRELGELALLESAAIDAHGDPATRQYLRQGLDLVREIVHNAGR